MAEGEGGKTQSGTVPSWTDLDVGVGVGRGVYSLGLAWQGKSIPMQDVRPAMGAQIMAQNSDNQSLPFITSFGNLGSKDNVVVDLGQLLIIGTSR